MTTLPHLSSPTTRATEQGRGQWIALLVRRWPTWLALSWAALTLADLEDGLELAVALLVASVGYLAITVIDRPGATWLVLAALLAAVVLLRVGGIDEWAVSIVAAALLAGVGLVRGPLRRPRACTPPSCRQRSSSAPWPWALCRPGRRWAATWWPEVFSRTPRGTRRTGGPG